MRKSVATLSAIAFVVIGATTTTTQAKGASSTASTVKRLEVKKVKHQQVINFFFHEKRKWIVALRHDKCWSAKPFRLPHKWEKMCYVARREVRESRENIARINSQLAKLRPRAVVLGSSWLVNAFLCIHRYEGAWNDTGDPYWGGLQMDWDFMSTYGGDLLRAKGPASNWTPAEQISVAIRAYNSGRGFGPWPNTRLSCGL